MSKPDQGYSWIIVLCCTSIHFALFGIFRSSGVLYVAVLDHYGITREEASWPFNLCAAILQISGLAASVLTRYVSQRKTCILCSVISAIGLVGCYFTESVFWINILYGIVHGFGFGVLLVMIATYINQYFVKYRSTAMGLAFAGGTVSSLIFPEVIELMLDSYGLSGTFLLLGGVAMNMVVVSMLMYDLEPKGTAVEKVSNLNDKNFTDVQVTVNGNQSVKISEKNINATDNDALCDESNAVYEKNNSIMEKNNIENDKNTYNKVDEISENDQNELEVREPLMVNNDVKIDNETDSKNWIKYVSRSPMMTILKRPIFYLIVLTTGSYLMSCHFFLLISVDFSMDKGIAESQGVLLISACSFADLIGRVGFGWVTDKKYLSRKMMMALNLAAIGIYNQLLAVLDSLHSLLAVSAFYGLSIGASISQFYLLQADFFGIEKTTLAVGMTSFFNGILSLLRPSIIGLFRDEIGSYSLLFHAIGSLCIFFSAIWSLQTYLTNRRSHNEKHCRTQNA